MSAKVDQFCDRLRERLNAIERWLESVKSDIQALPWRARKAHQTRLREAQAKLQAQKKRVEQTRVELKSQPQPVAEILESVFGWAAKPDPREPHVGPDAAETRVATTIDHAVAGIDEVGDTMLSAAVARLPAAGG